jgi:choline dehydrogenase-like flavoprotein
VPYRPEWLSEDAEVLVRELDSSAPGEVDYDVAIVGSGYGGAVAAARFACARTEAGKPVRTCVLERGREYLPGTFPTRFAELVPHVRFSRSDDPESKGCKDGLFDFRLGPDVDAMVANGLGGGSLVNAGVAERPDPDVFDDPAWPSALRRDLGELEQRYELADRMLRVQPAQVEGLRKYAAFDAYADAAGARARPARVTLCFEDEVNPQGITQRACIRCGDCVTGCNFRAKNTLATNYLPEAKRRGARLFTNATVDRVEKCGSLWRVWFRLTADRHPPLDPPERSLLARYVVLAAGAYGSTEILMRSRARGLRVSEKLGERFSTNGDMIGVLYDQVNPVNAAPEEATPFDAREVGPTIAGLFASGKTRAERVVVEELAIPAPLRRVFEEIVTTGALAARIDRFDAGCHRPVEPDPAAVDPRAATHSQVLAALGDDGARGRLEMTPGWESGASDGAIRVRWTDVGDLPLWERQDRLLAKSQRCGGTYLRNPLWRPLPTRLAAMLSGPKPGGSVFSVHPLGGCVMGEDAGRGVVDDIGRVFDPGEEPQGARVHAGLLVLDGSIVPVALGINPLLTITALAERAVAAYLRLQGWSPEERPAPALRRPPELPEPSAAERAVTAVRLSERMSGVLTFMRGGGDEDAELTVEFGTIRDLAAFLRQARHRVTIANATLALGKDRSRRARLAGNVDWMVRGETAALGRTLRALFVWFCSRGMADFFRHARQHGWWQAVKLVTQTGSLISLASQAGEVRYLRYDMTLEEDLALEDGGRLPRGTRLRGLKTFKYALGGNPWRQISRLAVRLEDAQGRRRAIGALEVDLLDFFRRFAAQLQIVGQADQPSAIMDVASLALFMLRVVARVHFWSFRAPDYSRYDAERDRRRMPGPLEGLRLDRHYVRVPDQAAPARREPLALPITRYRTDASAGKPPVLLVHGFGASGALFAHPRLQRNLVRHLAEKGYDVWVAELRTSIALPSSLGQWTLDEVAKEDIPAIADFVLAATGERDLHVVAHCIGSAMLCTAALAGTLAGKVRSAVLLQVGPLIRLSTGNKFRGYLAAAIRRYMLADRVDSSVDDRADWVNVMIDRLLATYPYDETERAAHRLWPPWAEHTHIANCNRSAGVFGRLFQHANVPPATLDLLGELLGHTNLTTFDQTVQYAFLERLTDYDACNAYVTEDRVREFFDFPVRFLHGELNDVFHPDTTARSEQLLLDVFGPRARVDRRVIEGYGHLDPLIGRDAERLAFEHISGFFASGPSPRPHDGAMRRHPVRPLLGPLLGWTRIENGTCVARIWCRLDDRRAVPAFLVAVVLDRNGHAVPGHTFWGWPIEGGSGRQPIDLLGVLDVPLPDGCGDLEIVVAGGYGRDGAARPPEEDVLSEPSEPCTPGRLADGYGGDVAKYHKEHWAKRLAVALEARRVCDDGYDEPLGSAWVTDSLRASLAPHDAIDFAVASCRFSASLLDREPADASFGVLRERLEDPSPAVRPPALLLLAGDQIYADATAGVFDPKNRRQRYYDAYRECWSAPNARAVLRRLPTYMMMDDHEVGDDWHPEDKRAPEEARLHAWGLDAFVEYQLAHSPRGGRVLGSARSDFFYQFESAGFPFFVCDTRSARRGREYIVSPAQREALFDWLQRAEGRLGDRPKFVVSPSVLVPFRKTTQGANPLYARSDGWDGFANSLRELFSHIAAEGIRNVVFLCGDPHFSIVSEIAIARKDADPLRALCVVASPLYAPMPFANARLHEYVEDSSATPLALDAGAAMHYRVAPGSHASGDSVTTVGVRREDGRWAVEVAVHAAGRDPRRTRFVLA